MHATVSLASLLKKLAHAWISTIPLSIAINRGAYKTDQLEEVQGTQATEGVTCPPPDGCSGWGPDPDHPCWRDTMPSWCAAGR